MRILDAGHVLSDDLRAFWPLDDGAGQLFKDISGWENHGRGTNAPEFDSAPFGGAVRFDGADDYIAVPAKSPINLSSAVALSVWIYPTGWGESNFGRLIDKDNGGSGWALYLDNGFGSSGVGWRFNGSTGGLYSILSLNAWQHLLISTPDAGTFTVWVNGVLRGSASGGAGIGTTSTALAIGNRASDTARAFAGRMANMRLWGRHRSSADAAMLYADPWAGTVRERRRVWYLPTGGGATVTVPAVNIAVAANAPSVAAGKSVAVPATNVAVAALAPAVAAGKNIAVPAVDIAVAALAPAVAAGKSIAVPSVNVDLAALAPTIQTLVRVAVPAIDVAIEALAPTITATPPILAGGTGRRTRRWRFSEEELPPELVPVVTAAEQLATPAEYVVSAVEDAVTRYRMSQARDSVERQAKVLRQAEKAVFTAIQRAQDEDEDDVSAVVM